MSDSIKLSKKYGVNPTMAVCFWCGNHRGDIALLGQIDKDDKEAPREMVLDYEPCGSCREKMDSGFTVIECTEDNPKRVMPIQKGAYPTGGFVVIKMDAATRIFGETVANEGVAFMTPEAFKKFYPR